MEQSGRRDEFMFFYSNILLQLRVDESYHEAAAS